MATLSGIASGCRSGDADKRSKFTKGEASLTGMVYPKARSLDPHDQNLWRLYMAWGTRDAGSRPEETY